MLAAVSVLARDWPRSKAGPGWRRGQLMHGNASQQEMNLGYQPGKSQVSRWVALGVLWGIMGRSLMVRSDEGEARCKMAGARKRTGTE